MAGAAGAVQGAGAVMGGIGDLMQALNYEPPHLDQPSNTERRLRRLAQGQLIGGGQETLGGMALYNQLAPILMGQLPGMHYVPGQGGQASGGAAGGPGAVGGQTLGAYQDALNAMNQSRGRQTQIEDLSQQIKGMKPGAERRGLRKQRQSLRREQKQSAPQWQLERRMYEAGSQPPQFDIRQAPPPTSQSSLGDINQLLAGLGQHPNLMSLYQGG